MKWKTTSKTKQKGRRPKTNGRQTQKKMEDLKKMKKWKTTQVQFKKSTLIGCDIIVN